MSPTTKSSKKIVILITALALFMEALDGTILNTAIPTIAHSLSIDPINLKIALISYLMSLAIFTPISGWIADKFGDKHIFIVAICLFSLSSLYCGFAQSLTDLVLGRFLQGLGGALMLPTARLILLRAVDRHQVINVMGTVVIIAAVGIMLGPTLGGIIVHYASWPWIFWVNIPVAILALFVANWGLKKNTRQAVAPLDYLGFVLFGAGLATLSFAFSSFSEAAIADSVSLGILLIGVVLLVSYQLHSSKVTTPIINTTLFQIRSFKISILGSLVTRLFFEGAPFLIPLLLQISLGYSTLISGLLLSPMALGVIFAKIFTNRVFIKFGYKSVLMINTALLGFALSSFVFIQADTSLTWIASLTLIYGFLIAVQYTGVNSLAYADLEPSHLGSATSINGTVQRVVQSFSVAFAALLIRCYSPHFTIPKDLSLNLFHAVFLTMGCATVLSAFVFVRLRSDDGRQLIT